VTDVEVDATGLGGGIHAVWVGRRTRFRTLKLMSYVSGVRI
jgi:hypothetical protein